mmetsp:Transcript_359/g.453  ORF Transcript_359/g.453 Transcript_359/m.453 type:complete len:577 (-) Transcript_359:338-2068(-)
MADPAQNAAESYGSNYGGQYGGTYGGGEYGSQEYGAYPPAAEAYPVQHGEGEYYPAEGEHGYEAQQRYQPRGGMRARAPGGDFMLPDVVKEFIFNLYQACRTTQIMEDIQMLYDIRFRELSEAYFKQSPWPPAHVIADSVGQDPLFLAFYDELRCRHLFATLKIAVDDRLEAWGYYCQLFDYLLEAEDGDFLVTAQWAFDIVHEFVYQFQSFCQFRSQVDRRSEAELALLTEAQDVWAVQNVLTYLHRLTRVSNVVAIMEAHRNRQPPPPGISNMHLMMGYFSIVGISRLECLLGDYHSALEILSPIDITDKSELFTSSLACHLNLFYHMGFAQLMLRRYRDCLATFSDVLHHINRLHKSGQLHNNPIADQVGKLKEKILALTVIACHFCPGQRLDDGVMKQMMEKHGDKARAMEAGGDITPFDELFMVAAPKFIVPSVPDYSQPINFSQDAIKQQMRLFREDVTNQLHLPKIRSYLKLYSTLSLEKLSRFTGLDENTLKCQLVSLKHRNRQVEHKTGPGALEGKVSHAMDINYYIKDGVIHVEEAEKEQRFDQYFLSQISKCQECTVNVQRLKIY